MTDSTNSRPGDTSVQSQQNAQTRRQDDSGGVAKPITAGQAQAARRRQARVDERITKSWLRGLAGRPR